MTSDTTSPNTSRAFPWRCHNCRQREVRPVVLPYRTVVRHDGVAYTIEVPQLTVPRCSNCGELVFDNAANDQISAALRERLNLLSPEQIQANRMALGMSPEELSARIGMPSETVRELEERLRIQGRALDNLLRVFFAVPQARAALDNAQGHPEFGLAVALANLPTP